MVPFSKRLERVPPFYRRPARAASCGVDAPHDLGVVISILSGEMPDLYLVVSKTVNGFPVSESRLLT
jgi:hypothetical protein